MLNRVSLAIATLSLAACSSEEPRRSGAPISDIEWTRTASGQTTQGRVSVGYDDDDHVKTVKFKLGGDDVGRMDFAYADGQVDAVDMTDEQGDQASMVYEYEDGRLTAMRWAIAQVVAAEQELEYDDGNGGRLRRVTSTAFPGATAETTKVETYDYDEAGRLEEISAIQDTSTWSSEIRYDDASRIERFTKYNGSDFETADLSYDDRGRLELVEVDGGDRYELTYNAAGLVEEILILAPSVGTTTRIEYRYHNGEIAGLTFLPELPLAGLVDLRGVSFDEPDLTAVALPLELDDVPSVSTSTCAHDVCVAGGALSSTCDDCAAAVCAADSYCCTSAWDSTCVSLVGSYCGFTC